MASDPQVTEYPRMIDAFDTLAMKPYTKIVIFDRRGAQDMSMTTDHGSNQDFD